MPQGPDYYVAYKQENLWGPYETEALTYLNDETAYGSKFLESAPMINYYNSLRGSMQAHDAAGRDNWTERADKLMEEHGLIGRKIKRRLRIEEYRAIFQFFYSYTSSIHAHQGDQAIKRDDDVDLMDVSFVSRDVFFREGGSAYIVGKNGSGKTNFMVFLMSRLSELTLNDRPLVIATNVKLYESFSERWGIKSVNALSDVLSVIAEYNLNGEDPLVVLFIDEFDQVLNAWRAMAKETRQMFSLINQIRKLGISIVFTLHFHADINKRHRNDPGMTIFMKGMFLPKDAAGANDAVEYKSMRDVVSCVGVWWQYNTMNLEGIPDMKDYFVSKASTSYTIDVDVEGLLKRIDELPMPKNNSQEEHRKRLVAQGKLIQKFLKDEEERMKVEVAGQKEITMKVRQRVIERLVAFRDAGYEWKEAAEAVQNEWMESEDNRILFEAAFPRGLKKDGARKLVERARERGDI